MRTAAFPVMSTVALEKHYGVHSPWQRIMPSTSTVVPHSTAMSVMEKSMSKKVGMTAQGQWAHHTTGNDRSVRLSSVL